MWVMAMSEGRPLRALYSAHGGGDEGDDNNTSARECLTSKAKQSRGSPTSSAAELYFSLILVAELEFDGAKLVRGANGTVLIGEIKRKQS